MERDLDELRSVVSNIGQMVDVCSHDRSIPDRDLRRTLAFLAQVIQVVEQAFQDVQSLLVDVSLLDDIDIRDHNEVQEIRRRAGQLTARSYYRDAAEICSRLKYLGETFNQNIRPRVDHLSQFNGWGGVFGLIEHREGRIIRLVEETASSVEERLARISPVDLDTLHIWSRTRITELRSLLGELHMLNGRIMGYSGNVGFLELTSDRNRLEREVTIMVDKLDQSVTHGHRVDVGPGAVISGNFVVATTIADSFKTVIAEAKGTSELREELARLCSQMDGLMPALAEDKRTEVKKDMETFVTEATKAEPRRKWYELSAEGLIDAAKACGELALPIIATVQRIVSMLTGGA